MKRSKTYFRAMVVLGISSLTIVAVADTYTPNFVVPEIHGGGSGSNTSSSFTAASLMGEKGFSNTYLGVVQATLPPGWQNTITSACETQTRALAGPPIGTGTGPLSVWPSVCNPHGMARALNALIAANGGFASWVVHMEPGTPDGQTRALNQTVISFQTYRSPAMVPIYGQADHWITVREIVATPVSPGVFTVTTVRGFDGGPAGGLDSNELTYNSGPQSWSAFIWKQNYYLVVTAINKDCDFRPLGCGGSPQLDPYYGKYVLMYEPPPGQQPAVNAHYEKSASVVPPGHMTAQLAQVHVWRALVSAGIDDDPDIWNKINGGVAGPASLVHGRFPDGSPWDYYVVPILPSRFANTAIAFVELSADDGSFHHVQVPSSPVIFTPASRENAAQRARGALARGEGLAGGILTWDPMSHARSPSFPYYEFSVVGASEANSVIRVKLHDGVATRGRQARVSH